MSSAICCATASTAVTCSLSSTSWSAATDSRRPGPARNGSEVTRSLAAATRCSDGGRRRYHAGRGPGGGGAAGMRAPNLSNRGERRDGQRLRTGRIRYELGLGTPAFEERSESRPKDRETKARPVQAALTSSNFKWSRIRPTRS